MLSQTQGTASTGKVEIPASQVTELYKIVKQNTFLKATASAAEKALNEANKTIKAHEVLLGKKDAALKLSEELLVGAKKEHQKDLEIKNIQIERLQFQLDESYKTGKKVGRKKFWNGFAIGGVTVGILGGGTLIYILSR